MSDEVPFTAINSRFLQVFKENPDARELVFYGGSGSSKSTSVAQILLKQFLDTKQPPVRMLFSRKWLSALKNTLLVDCIRILQAWGAYDPDRAQQKRVLHALREESDRLPRPR